MAWYDLIDVLIGIKQGGDEMALKTGSVFNFAATLGASAINFGGAHADYTLSAAEKQQSLLTVTNADASANILATPTLNRFYLVVNGSGQQITLKAAGQTGVAVPNGYCMLLRGNGTDFVDVLGGKGLVSLTATQTLTNKTLTTPVIASFYQDAGKTQLMSAPNTASDTLAAIAAVQTLTNKTLTTPVIASMYQDAGKTQLMSLPNTASDTLAAIAAIQTLTNKTLTAPVITTPDMTLGVAAAHDYAGGNADWTVSAADLKANFLSTTNAGVGSAKIILPNTSGRLYMIRNGSGQDNVAGITGTAVTIANGRTAIVFHSGTDYVRITADAAH